jgi:HSP20 family protein
MLDLVRWPFSTFGTPFQLHREIDEVLTRFFDQGQTRSATPSAQGVTPTWWPAVESWASEDTLHLRVALPGVDPKDVELSVTDNVLTIKGHRKPQGEAKDPSYFLREFGYGAFERSLGLPEWVDPARVTAKYANGMLEVTMPAQVAVAPKKVEIQIDGQPDAQKAINVA